ncbi:PKD domain-containing protein [Hymenobacter monticola]|uniref:PKD domain-containing protein n=1 Tax=Hymenobacter monticola TaxID=1705399 RepID=A0ABY4B7S0_9BACT|nr:PKD domain-containing protein [Hymenobacter monticola]UOE35225.1 PKD domain-containing protein [Hymenobacter monticola]
MHQKITLQLGLLLASLPALAGNPAPVGPPPASAIEFVANRNQWEKPVLFAADVHAGRLFLERGRLVQSLYDSKQVEKLHELSARVSNKQRVRAHAYSTTFLGASAQAAVQGEAKLPGLNNYFLGNDKSRWASNVPGYGEVRYAALYPGIDLHFYSKERVLEYDFEVAAGADASRIALRYEGQTKLQIVKGALNISTTVGTVVEQRPYAYQLVDGRRQRVACDYALGKDNTVTFALPQGYNHRLPLVIDPVLVYSTYTGSTSNFGFTATYDSVGNLYAGGTVFGVGYPTTVGAYDVSFNSGIDMGIMKFDPRATTGPASRVYATYMGGTGSDYPHSLVVDRNNNLIILGSTNSGNYPTTPGAYDTTLGGTDIVLTKLNAAGSALVGSTFLGGSGLDGQLQDPSPLRVNYGDYYRGDVTVDRNNNIFIASMTSSTNFPVTSTNFQSTSGGGASDGVVCKLNATLTSLIWSSYLGGSGADAAYSVQIDSVNNVFVAGGTSSPNFPGVQAGFRSTYQGGSSDGFVARISAAGDDLTQSTYLGTSAYDQVHFVQLNRFGEVYTYGQTLGNYPVTAGTYSNPGSRQFIQKLNARLTAGVYSTVIGNGPGSTVNLSPTAFLVDNCGQIMISGWTSQGNMPITPNAIQSTGGSGTSSNGIGAYFYIGQLSANAQTLVYGTYFGNGNCHVDGGTSRFDKRGIIYQSMCAGGGSGNVLTTPNAWSATNPGGYNNAAFKMDVLQLSAEFVPTLTATSTIRQANLCAPATFYFNRPAATGTSTLWNFGNGQTSTLANNATITYTQPGKYAVRLTVFDVNNCLQSVSTVDTVTVYAVPQPRVAPSSRQTICVNSSVTLSATNLATGTPNVTYTWTTPGQPPLTGASVTARPLVTTRYTVTANTPANVGGCSGTDTVTVRVIPRLVVVAGPARTICPGTATTLSVADAGTGATYTWTAPGQPTLTGRTVTVSPTTSVRYLVRVVNSTGCVGRDSVQFTVPPAPVLAATASAPNLVGKPVTFTNTTTGATSYRWDFGDNTPTTTEVNPSHIYATANPKPGYQARLTAIYGPGCEASLIVPVPVRGFDLPNVITPNGDQQNDTFRPFVTTEKVDIQIFNRWGRKVFEQANYSDGWGSDAELAAGVYYYRLVSASGESWKGWIEVVK